MIKADRATFKKEVVESDIPVMVDFYADWCPPCERMEPMLEKLEKEYEGKIKFVKVDADKEQELAEICRIANMPTYMIVEKGKVLREEYGAMEEEKFRKFLDNKD